MTQFPHTIRFRPESQADAMRLLEDHHEPERFLLVNPEPEQGTTAAMHALGGMIWEIEVRDAEDMTDLVHRMLAVPDGHRMLQTLDLAENFTGIPYEGADERSERILALMNSAPAHITDGYRQVAGPIAFGMNR